jgi:hypothetical protein
MFLKATPWFLSYIDRNFSRRESKREMMDFNDTAPNLIYDAASDRY